MMLFGLAEADEVEVPQVEEDIEAEREHEQRIGAVDRIGEDNHRPAQ